MNTHIIYTWNNIVHTWIHFLTVTCAILKYSEYDSYYNMHIPAYIHTSIDIVHICIFTYICIIWKDDKNIKNGKEYRDNRQKEKEQGRDE